MDDPSEFRPEFKDKTEFRDFNIHTVPERVKKVKTCFRYTVVDQKKSFCFLYDIQSLYVLSFSSRIFKRESRLSVSKTDVIL